jgi:DNA-binding NarL/FixJ family response regulator
VLDRRVQLSDRPPAARPDQGELTVVVADDHPGVVGHLRGLLSSVAGITVVGAAASGREAVRLALRHNPDVLVLDLRMRELTGVEAIRAVRRCAPHVAVLVFTACEDDESVLTAVRAGARGYLLKCAQDEDIIRAVRGVAAGEAIFGQSIAPRVINLMADPRTAQPVPPLPALTARERAVLDLLVAGMGDAAIAARLQITPKTVGNVIYSAVAKLGVPDRAGAIARVRSTGGPLLTGHRLRRT